MNTQSMRIGGALCYWDITKSTSLPMIADGLKSFGLAKYIPEPRTQQSCLRAVLDDVYVPPEKEQRYVVRPVKNGITGFAVVSERPKDHAMPGDDWGTVIATAGFTEDGTLVVEPHDYDKVRAIEDGMRGAAEWLPAASVGKCLSELIEYYDGVTLRSAGGLYWLNNTALDDWKRVADLFEAASVTANTKPSNVYALSVTADDQMIRAVGNALTDEVEAACRAIEDDVKDPDMRPNVCLRRMEKAGEVEAKVRRYEAAFGEPMAKLTALTQQAATNAAMACLKASAAQVAANKA
jgi:hypothetical protein